MTPEDYAAYQAKHGVASFHDPDAGRFPSATGHPLKDALVADVDPDAVAEGAELELQYAILKELRGRGWLFVYHNPTKPTGATLGTPDFIILAPWGKTILVECKTKGGKLSKDQQKFKRDAEAAGHTFNVVRSLKAFLKVAPGLKI